MSVVLNIPMPDRCCDCDLEYDCVACGITGTRHYRTGVDFDPSNQRHDDCPIICQLPEGHGRLVDADALLRDIEKYHVSEGKFQHWLELQPTIVPAERRET